MSERIRTVDFAKGICIFMIVILHAIFSQPSWTSDTIQSNVFVDFFYTALLLFYMFSGYFYRPERSSSENIKKRLIQLTLVSTILLLILPAILLIYYMILGLPVGIDNYLDTMWHLIGGDNIFDPVSQFMHNGYECGVFLGYYYIQVLILACIIFYPTVKFVIRSWKTLSIVVLITISVTAALVGFYGLKLPFYAQLAPIAAAFMYVGAFLKKYDVIGYIDRGCREKRYWIILIAVLASAIILLVFLPPGHAFDFSYFGEYSGLSVYQFFITVLLSCYVLMVLFSFLARIPIFSDIFCCFGKHTLAILLLHTFIIKLLVVPFFGVSATGWFPLMSVPVSIVAGILGVIISAVIAILLLRYRTRSIAAVGVKPINEM